MALIRVFDIETTGGPAKFTPDATRGSHKIIELGILDVETGDPDTGIPEIVDQYHSFYNPGDQPVDIAALAVHHITPDVYADAMPSETAFNALDHGSPAIYCAHFAKFEKMFYNPEGSWWICTYLCAKRSYLDAAAYGNQYLRYYLGLDLDSDLAMPPHAALPDAYVTAHILMDLLKKHTVKELIHWSRLPAYMPTIGFGKHQGKKWEDVDGGYLSWILKQADMEEDIKYYAREEINRRG